MLGSYAAQDHREKIGQEKKTCIELPNRPSGIRHNGVDDQKHSLRSDSHQAQSAIAEQMSCHPFLF
jgi:hypothetical protein